MTELTVARVCPACAEPIGEADAFCEACGRPLPAIAAAVTAPDGAGCPTCGAAPTERDPDGYCQGCGHRWPRAADHVEVDAGTAAGLSDRGHRHRRNEDAVAVRVVGGSAVLTVCDGVSQSANPDRAAAACAAAADHLTGALAARPDADLDAVAAMLTEAVAAAHEAVLGVPAVEPGGYADAPSSTLVAAVVRSDGIAIANIGDSRAYWIDAAGARQLSVDDSLAQEAIAAGVAPGDAHAAAGAHTLTRWLGADAAGVEPHLTTLRPSRPGRLLLCSDGLWNSYEDSESLFALVAAGPRGETMIEASRRLVRAALDAGATDNVSVAMAAPTEE